VRKKTYNPILSVYLIAQNSKVLFDLLIKRKSAEINETEIEILYYLLEQKIS